MKRKYAIWNKQDPIITPVGEIFTAEQWIKRYPVAAIPSVIVICGSGEINGSYFGTLGQMVDNYEREGCDFSGCTTPEEKLAAIEDFMEARRLKQEAEIEEAAKASALKAEMDSASLASIAASMEYQNMLTLPDEEEI